MKICCFFIISAVLLLIISACGSSANNTLPTAQSDATSSTTNNATLPDTTNPSITQEQDYKPDYAEAARLFESFLAAVTTIEDNPDDFLNTLLPHRPHLGVQYQRFVQFTNGTDDEWLAKTALERFILHETYLRPLYQLTLGQFDAFFGSESAFLDNIRSPLQSLTREGNGLEADAFRELMLWQFEYITNTGTVFNFATGQSHLENRQDN